MTLKERFASREFIVFLTATVLLAVHLIDATIWQIIAMVYVGARTVQKIKKV